MRQRLRNRSAETVSEMIFFPDRGRRRSFRADWYNISEGALGEATGNVGMALLLAQYTVDEQPIE